ncbi:MAG: YihY/virulence factor BrkB family protein [Terriglobales bacterium]|jgi:membrane protein
MKETRPSQWKFGGLTPLGLGKQVVNSLSEDDLAGQSAELSYYFFLALFPLLIFLVSLLGYFASAGTQLRTDLMANLSRAVPPSAGELVQKTLNEIIHSRGAGKVLFGAIAALWSASSGMSAIMETLNRAYHVKEARSYIRKKLISIALTVGTSALVLCAMVLALYGGKLADVVAAHVGLGSALVYAWKIAQWPVLLGAMLAAFALVYYFAPNIEEPHWTWISPGAAAGLVIWLAASFALRVYLHFFNSYSSTYGSLGAVIILMLWLYLSGFALLLGGEVNSATAHAEVEKAKQEEKDQQREKEFQRDLQAA